MDEANGDGVSDQRTIRARSMNFAAPLLRREPLPMAQSKRAAHLHQRLPHARMSVAQVHPRQEETLGLTALHIAVMHGNADVMIVLLEGRVDPAAHIHGETPLDVAQRFGYEAMFADAIEHVRRKYDNEEPQQGPSGGSAFMDASGDV